MIIKMKNLIGPAILGALLGASALYGQTRVQYAGGSFQFAGAAGAETRVIEGLGSQTVTGKPFSAEEDRHSVQTLGDGTRIESSEKNRLFRDELGRTRIERTVGNITISDPVAGFQVELNPVTKTGTRTVILTRYIAARTPGGPITFLAPGDNTAALRAKLDETRAQLAQAQSQYTDQSPRINELKAQLADLEKASNQDSVRQLQNLTASYSIDYASRNEPPPGQADAMKRQAEAQASTLRLTVTNGTRLEVPAGENATVESLPSQVINGVLSQGTRTTATIPVGKIGNDRAISIVNERWYSADLQMLVKSTSSDPRFGETTYQLMNVVQASPDPSLFLIPADYTIRK
jgi:hypothetical protein